MAVRYMVAQYDAAETLPSAALLGEGFVLMHGGVFKRVVDAAWETVAAGPQGDPGDTGADGAPGLDGADGAPGLDGADGVDGVTMFRGVWDIAVFYIAGDVVQHDVDLYQALSDSTGVTPDPIEPPEWVRVYVGYRP